MHAPGYGRPRYSQLERAILAYLLEAQRLIKFPRTDNVWKGAEISSLSQCCRPICDVALRHVCTVAVCRKAGSLCPQRA